jgi:protease IV
MLDYYSLAVGGMALYGAYNLIKPYAKRKPKNSIAKIYLIGEIHEYTSGKAPFGIKRQITPGFVEDTVEAAIEAGVRGIIFEIDSPGGHVVPTKVIGDYIKNIKVPTVALVKGSAVSGSYWIASACDTIIANPLSTIGSIGVIMNRLEISRLSEIYGIRSEVVKAGKYKDLGNIFRPFTAEEREFLQGHLDFIHQEFIREISVNRKLDEEQVKLLANGLIYDGRKSIELGLVDSLGGIDEAISYIEDIAGFKHTKIVEYEGKTGGLLSGLISRASTQIGIGISQGLYEAIKSNNEFEIK